MGVFSSPSIPLDGLVFSIDAGNIKSYSGSGTNVLDPINNISGVMNNGVVFSTLIGGYFSFDGTDDKILYPLNSAYDISQSITIEAHIRPTSYPTAGGGGMIITKVASYYLEFASNGKIRVYFGGLNSPGYHESVSTVYLNVWTHVTITRDFANNTINIYINGVLDRTISGITGNITVQQTYGLSVGGYSAGGYLFVGHIACGKIYNRALSGAEVAQLYNATKDRYIYREELTKSNLILNIDVQSLNSYTTSETTLTDLAFGNKIQLFQTSYLTYDSVSPRSLRFGRTLPPTANQGAYGFINGLNAYSYNTYLSNNHSTEVWFKINDINPTNHDATEVASAIFVYSGYHCMFYYNVNEFYYNLWFKQAGVNYYIDAKVTVGLSNAVILPNVWYQALATKTSNTISLYINGILKATTSIPYSTISDNITSNLYIGTANIPSGGSPYKFNADCTIGVIRMYNRALTSTEILSNFNALRGRYGI